MNKSITIEQIENLNGIDLIHEVFVTIVLKQNEGCETTRKFVERLPDEQKLVYAIWILDMNVKNGGFQQYYHNSGGEILDFSLLAAKEMNMEIITEIVAKANIIFLESNFNQKETSFSDEQRQELFKLDKEYYFADTDEFIYNSIANFIKLNKGEFVVGN